MSDVYPGRTTGGRPRWWLGIGDRLPGFAAIVTDDNGVAVDLTGAVVVLALRQINGNADWVEMPLTVANPTTGTVAYDWQAADVAPLNPGVVDLAVRVAFPDGTGFVAPSAGHAELIVWD